jgi:hypothetical protein
MVGSRVTRLGEFLPNGRLFTLGSVLKVLDVAQNFWLLVFTVPVMYKCMYVVIC